MEEHLDGTDPARCLETVNLTSWAREYDQDRNCGEIYLRKYKVNESGKDFKIFRAK